MRLFICLVQNFDNFSEIIYPFLVDLNTILSVYEVFYLIFSVWDISFILIQSFSILMLIGRVYIFLLYSVFSLFFFCWFRNTGYWSFFVHRDVFTWFNRSWNWKLDWDFCLGRNFRLFPFLSSLGLWVLEISLCLEVLDFF